MNPILNKMGANANEQKKLLMECVLMLEKYVNRFPAEKGCASYLLRRRYEAVEGSLFSETCSDGYFVGR